MPGPHRRWATLQLQRQALAQDLQQRHHLRLHGTLMGAFTLALTWAGAIVLRRWGVDSLALRYLLALGLGYGAYLLLLRWWAQQLLQPAQVRLGDAVDGVELGADIAAALPRPRPAPASGVDAAETHVQAETGVADWAEGALEAVGSADEGAVVVVPVLALFAIGTALFMGAGALALLFFGWDALLAVAVELAFASVAARTTMGLERHGWLGAAMRLTCKPMLAALLCAVALGAAIDHWLPGAQTLPQALQQLRR